MASTKGGNGMRLSTLFLVVLPFFGCAGFGEGFGAAGLPTLTPQQVYDQCMARPYNDKPEYKEVFMRLRKTICGIKRDRVARGVDPDADAVAEPYQPVTVPAGSLTDRLERDRQRSQLECLRHAVLPFHCSY